MTTPYQIIQFKQKQRKQKMHSSTAGHFSRDIQCSSRQVSKNKTKSNHIKSLTNEEQKEENIKYEITLRRTLRKVNKNRYKNNRQYSERYCSSEKPHQKPNLKFQHFQRKLHSARQSTKKRQTLIIEGQKDNKMHSTRNNTIQFLPYKANIVYPTQIEDFSYKNSFPQRKTTIVHQYANFLTKKRKKYEFYEASVKLKKYDTMQLTKQTQKTQNKSKNHLRRTPNLKKNSTKMLQKKIIQDTPGLKGWQFHQDEDNSHF